MYWVYVIQSQSRGSIYTGHTDDLERRLEEHQKGITFYTRNKEPWMLIYSEQFKTRAEAMAREKYFKTGVGREFLKPLPSGIRQE